MFHLGTAAFYSETNRAGGARQQPVCSSVARGAGFDGLEIAF
jgi:hypothetical protein